MRKTDQEDNDFSDKHIKEVATQVAATNDSLVEFMKGYTRDVHMTGKVLSALARSMEKHPTLRLGQLIYNALETQTNKETNGTYDPVHFRTNFHSILFNTYDERLIEALDQFDGESVG